MGSYNGNVVLPHVSPIDPLNLTPSANLVAQYTGNDTFADASGNGHTLEEVGAVTFMPIDHTNNQAFYFNGIGELQLVTPSTDFAFVGDYTVAGWIWVLLESAYYITCYDSPTTGSADDNELWGLQRGAPTSSFNRGSLMPKWEYGTGTSTNFVSDMKPAFSPVAPAFFAGRRQWTGSTWQQDTFINAYSCLQGVNTNANTPTGGANSRLKIGSNGQSTSRIRGALAYLSYHNAAASDGAILAEAIRLGVRK